jgi:hypothetical protein
VLRPASVSAAAMSKGSIRTPRTRNWSIKPSRRARVDGSVIMHPSQRSSRRPQGARPWPRRCSGRRCLPGRHTQSEDGLGGLDLTSNCTRPSWKARTRRT